MSKKAEENKAWFPQYKQFKGKDKKFILTAFDLRPLFKKNKSKGN